MAETSLYNQKQYKFIGIQDLLKYADEVWKNSTIQNIEVEGYPDKTVLKPKFLDILTKKSRKIIRNVNSIIPLAASSNWIGTNVNISVGDLIEELGDDEILREVYSDYYRPRSSHYYKYVSRKHARESVEKGILKFGTAKDYGFADPRDSLALLDYVEPVSEEDFFDIALGELTTEMLKDSNISLKEKKITVNDTIGKLHYIGCVTDLPDSKYMWDNYGAGGVCMEVNIPQLDIHRITYSDQPLSPSYIRKKLKSVTQAIENGSQNNAKNQYIRMMKLVGSMGLLNLYRKDAKYECESEWRILLKESDLIPYKGIRYLKVPILRVVSDLPGYENKKLRKFCIKNGIRFERRICRD